MRKENVMKTLKNQKSFISLKKHTAEQLNN